MYTDAYPSAVPSDRLDRLAGSALACWGSYDAQQARRCAFRAAQATLCPCLTLAAGGLSGDREHAILDAVVDEMQCEAERQTRSPGTVLRIERPTPAVTGLVGAAHRDRICPLCGVSSRPPDGASRVGLLVSCAPHAFRTWDMSRPPEWPAAPA